MSVTAEAVKQLRERTGAGMMECKKALLESNGDLDAAAELMRKQGLAKADKKATRIAAEGVIAIAEDAERRLAAMVEVNCETDFVAREADFSAFAAQVARAALLANPVSLDALLATVLPDGATVDERRRALVAKIGENIAVRRFARLAADDVLGTYVHGTRVGVMVALRGGDAVLARDIAMHIAASQPRYLSFADVPAAELAKEREILTERARHSGKPADIVAKMVEGQLRKAVNEMTLLGQPFVKNPEQTVEQLLRAAGAQVVAFERFEKGAGIEKRSGDFVGEVMAQVKASSK
ncbi:MAG: translation elongation factor Ts [Steroidobacteraceae bacterium]|nr:translation elongation factor Ts [Steroidobacteraceae bacterium]MDW8259817.1 translation elongation factor Ts [Gammaproteobacteria bacterium]